MAVLIGHGSRERRNDPAAGSARRAVGRYSPPQDLSRAEMRAASCTCCVWLVYRIGSRGPISANVLDCSTIVEDQARCGEQSEFAENLCEAASERGHGPSAASGPLALKCHGASFLIGCVCNYGIRLLYYLI